MAEPRVLLYDLETSHNVVAAFQLRNDDYIPHRNILQERYIICAAWKEFGRKTVDAVATTDFPRYGRNPHDDVHVVERLHEVLSAADVIVAHNGNKFDRKFLNARFIAHKLPPLPPILQIDTCAEARKHFLFNSNRLDYLGEFMGIGRKADTEPGLWLKVLAGDAKAVRAMVRYNKRDVDLLESVFLRLRPYIQGHMNRHLLGNAGCPRCGSRRTQRRGFHHAIARKYQRWQCCECGGWWKESRAEPEGAATRLL